MLWPSVSLSSLPVARLSLGDWTCVSVPSVPCAPFNDNGIRHGGRGECGANAAWVSGRESRFHRSANVAKVVSRDRRRPKAGANSGSRTYCRGLEPTVGVDNWERRWVLFLRAERNGTLLERPQVAPLWKPNKLYHEPMFDVFQSSYADVEYELNIMRNAYIGETILFVAGDGLALMRLNQWRWRGLARCCCLCCCRGHFRRRTRRLARTTHARDGPDLRFFFSSFSSSARVSECFGGAGGGLAARLARPFTFPPFRRSLHLIRRLLLWVRAWAQH